MPARRRIDPVAGEAALARWRADPGGAPSAVLATAVRHTLAQLAERHRGNTVEVRVPPYGAVQCMAGLRHRRGTPPNVVETDAVTWLELVTGALTWAQALESGRLHASGTRVDLAALLA
ncbi:MAG: sterol carrier family protein [Sporichthyaceae bacterium]